MDVHHMQRQARKRWLGQILKALRNSDKRWSERELSGRLSAYLPFLSHYQLSIPSKRFLNGREYSGCHF
jgi:hypothetical protein